MTYAETVSYLLTVGQELRGLKFDLANVSCLLEALDHPERCWNSVHIAGTNGKGSVAAMMEAVLRAAGYRTALYTSPHLVRVNERIRVAGQEISDADFASVCGDVLALVERLLAERALPGHPSFFECLTATAFEHFRRAGCDIAVLETGMGGRLDATNVVRPLVSIITPVDFDHEAYLGHSLGQIAFEKAGIIKEGGVVIAAPQRPEAAAVIERVAQERGARLIWDCGLRNAECGMRRLLRTPHSTLRIWPCRAATRWKTPGWWCWPSSSCASSDCASPTRRCARVWPACDGPDAWNGSRAGPACCWTAPTTRPAPAPCGPTSRKCGLRSAECGVTRPPTSFCCSGP